MHVSYMPQKCKGLEKYYDNRDAGGGVVPQVIAHMAHTYNFTSSPAS